MRRVARWLLLPLVLVLAAFWLVHRQGASAGALRALPARVVYDERHIPTLEGASWPEIVEAQGFVTAADRLFQMDLMRRAAAGRLAEWFGPAALPLDRRRALEDWAGAATRALAGLEAEEKAALSAYARGVNRFIESCTACWGLEYLLLSTRPERWEERDSLLVVLAMSDQLASAAPAELSAAVWRRHLPEVWTALLFTSDHPWNRPRIGAPRPGPALPRGHALPAEPLSDEERRVSLEAGLALAGEDLRGADEDGVELAQGERAFVSPPGRGASNNWAWCGRTGCFLANDPHLSATVPHLWYANRLRRSAEDWVVGVSIPGLPGVVLGMNPHLAWAFTNVGEDVDDVLLEELSADGQQYVAEVVEGEKRWRPVREERRTIRVRGQKDEEVVARSTHRGPLLTHPSLGTAQYSRQWLPLGPSRLRAPYRFNFARSWEEMNRALDDFLVPAQNVVVLDRAGNMGWRASGTGVLRTGSGGQPRPAVEGEWRGFAPAADRPRRFVSAATTAESRFIATANERQWVDEQSHRWAEDLRKDRLQRLLSERTDFTSADMERMQRDTESRYYRRVLGWVLAHAAVEGERRARWERWRGGGEEDPATFTEAAAVERALVKLLLDRVRRRYLPPEVRQADYDTWMKSAWVLATLDAADGPAVFGLEPASLAQHLVGVAEARRSRDPALYPERNRWAAQHPFVGRIWGLSALFAVDTPPQPGWRGVLRVEQPTYGASVRMVWDLARPLESRWSLPVGQSGHAGTRHYHDLQASWFAGEPFPVFDRAFEWVSAPAPGGAPP